MSCVRCAVFLFLFAHLVSANTDEIIAVEAKLSKAISTGDSVTLESLLADDLVYTHSLGSVVTKRQFIRELKADVSTINYSDRKIQLFGKVAVLTAQAHHRCVRK